MQIVGKCNSYSGKCLGDPNRSDEVPPATHNSKELAAEDGIVPAGPEQVAASKRSSHVLHEGSITPLIVLIQLS
jgi:hypothetical protein